MPSDSEIQVEFFLSTKYLNNSVHVPKSETLLDLEWKTQQISKNQYRSMNPQVRVSDEKLFAKHVSCVTIPQNRVMQICQHKLRFQSNNDKAK